MTDSDYPEAATPDNSRSLNTLIRAITLSSGRRFSLIFVRCNYRELQEQICQDLHQHCGVEIRELVLSPSTNTLYGAIKTEVGDEPLSALMILGLENVTDLDNLLLATNHIREEFRKNFKFPLVIWVTDEVLKQFVRLIPDFYNWGAPPISFFLTSAALIEFLNRGVEAVFAQESVASSELELARQDLQGRGEEVGADLAAGLEFVWGREAYFQDNLDDAIAHYQRSLSLGESPPNQHPERKGMIWVHLGLCSWRQAELNRAEKRRYWQEARDYFHQGLAVFEGVERPDLVARFIGELGEVLQRLEAWDRLQELAEKGLRLHHVYGSERQQARDYGFLAEVALARGNWQEAKRLANQALQCRDAPWRVSTNVPDQGHSLYLFLLAKAQQGLNQIPSAIETLERVRVETHPQDNPQVYSDSLKELQRLYFNQQEYLKAFAIKQEQGLVESQLGLRAFIGASRLQPLPGESQDKVALEITASGRGRDVERLIGRIARDDCKLTVIHGQSGVGKSSIVNGGLVPALRQKQMVKGLDVLPIPVRVYTNWVEELGRLLVAGETSPPTPLLRGEETSPPAPLLRGEGGKISRNTFSNTPLNTPSNPPLNTPPSLAGKGAGGLGLVLEQLQQNEQRHRLVVLIFDQFEEFFFVCQDTATRKPFFEFLSDCLNLPYLKVILSLREDYLHYLLECERLARIDVINNDILNKSNRYELGDFAPEDAQGIIEQLTARSQFHLESELVEQLVQDLAEDTGKVRPIELQIVGAQLQAEEITTLAEYRQRGTKDELVKRYVEAVIQDCGTENQRVGELVLYLLTDEKNTRPLKTRADLVSELTALPLDGVMESQQLELALKIFVDSGLVVEVPEKPEDRYQLVHDYLVELIRQQEGFGIVAELKAEREKRRRSEAQLKVVEKTKKQIVRGGVAVVASLSALAVGMIVLASRANQNFNLANRKLENAQADLTQVKESEEIAKNEIKKITNEVNTATRQLEAANKKRQAAEQQFKDTQLKLTDATKKEQEAKKVAAATVQQAQQAEREVKKAQEREKLANANVNQAQKELAAAQAERDRVNREAEAKIQDAGERVANARQREQEANQKVQEAQIALNQAKAEREEAQAGTRLERAGVAAIKQFEYQSIEALMTAMEAGQELKELVKDGRSLEEYPAASPLLALQTILDNIWERNQLQHQGRVNAVAFSPDGKQLLTSSFDGTARLWDNQGNLIKELTGHQDSVIAVAISPDGKQLLTGSGDNTARLWDNQGNLINELTGHQNLVIAVAFSLDGKQILTGSGDYTARLWDNQGNLIEELTGHQGQVWDVAFSPDGKQILTGSFDGTARLWDNQGNLIEELTGHQGWVFAVDFSPDGKQILTGSLDNTGSWDNTARLWDNQGNLIKELTGHQGGINAVGFSPDGQQILTGSYDQTARLWDNQGNLIKELTGHQDSVIALGFSPDGEQILTGSLDNTARLWDNQGNLIKELTGHQGWVFAVGFSPDGQQILTGSWDNTARLWDNQGNLIKELTEHQRGINAVGFSPDGEQILTGSWDKTARLWDNQGNLIKELTGHQDSVTAVAFSPDGRQILTGSSDKTARLWDNQGSLIKELTGHQDSVIAVAFSPDGKQLLTGSYDKTARLWDNQGQSIKELTGHQDSVIAVGFSPDGQQILTGSADTTALLWDNQGILIKELTGHQDSVIALGFSPDGQNAVGFSPDGEQILTGSRDNTARLWDNQGNLIKELTGHQGWVIAVSFSPDGQQILTGSSDGTTRLWDLQGRQIAEFAGYYEAISPDWRTIALRQEDKVVLKPGYRDLDELLAQGCDWLKDYLATQKEARERLRVCRE
ncbi:MAG: hypothetical protein RH949_23610 [Coleofasciculus sp. A1-SPW-01]|uniref:nSTAND1 domain-containing NTPase n=1 Tax=Coleofasciculus sp. A1-SPW-01 TaxID=3070819 RepID=UPI0032F3E195